MSTFKEWFKEDDHDLYNYPEEAMEESWNAALAEQGEWVSGVNYSETSGHNGVLTSVVGGRFVVTVQTQNKSDIDYLTECAQLICRTLPSPPKE